MEHIDYDRVWKEIEEANTPCKIKLLCGCKKTYTGPGKEYTPLWSQVNSGVPVILEEVKRGKNNVLWGRLKNGNGWIELTEIQLLE